MIGIHDIGGHHFGPIPNTTDDKVFHEPWEGLAFALTLVSATAGKWTLDEFRHAIENMPPHEYLTTPYYVHWLEAIEELNVREGHVTREELADRQKAIRAGEPLPPLEKHEPDPEVLEKLRKGTRDIAYVGLGARRPDQPQLYKVGDQVRATTKAIRGHTRLPRYIWGKTGVVVAYSGTFVMPDTAAHRQGDNPEPSYAVRFESSELWGNDAEPNTSVTIDLFDRYIEPASSNVGKAA